MGVGVGVGVGVRLVHGLGTRNPEHEARRGVGVWESWTTKHKTDGGRQAASKTGDESWDWELPHSVVVLQGLQGGCLSW